MANLISNETIKHMLERRSIRDFKPEQISEDQLETILHCGFNAPSGMNCQSWFLTVIQDREVLDDWHKSFVKSLPPADQLPPIMQQRLKNPNYDVFYHAPTLILVSFEKEKGPLNSGFLGQNMVLAAQSLGLGTCYIGGAVNFLGSPEGKPVLDRMKLPEGCQPCFGVAIGQPNEQPDARPRDFTKLARI